MLMVGLGGRCTKRLANSQVVNVPTAKKARRVRRGINDLEGKRNVELAKGLKIIVPQGDYSTEGC